MAITLTGAALALDALLADTRWASLWNDDSTEVSGGGYARQEVSFGATVENTTGIQKPSDTVVLFGPSTESWGTVTYVKFHDGTTAQTILCKKFLNTSESFAVVADRYVSFDVGTMTATIE
jgi:hypothetical protein